jgi:hypothetical protein
VLTIVPIKKWFVYAAANQNRYRLRVLYRQSPSTVYSQLLQHYVEHYSIVSKLAPVYLNEN